MNVIENEIALPAPPKAVWRVLTDFERYAAWHPFIRLDGVPEVGRWIGYRFTSALIPRHSLRAQARITRLEPGAVLEWRTGLRFLLDFTETYALRPHPTGSRLAHRIEYHGLVARLSRGGLAARGHAMLCQADAALRSHLARRGTPARPMKPAVRKPRKGGRR